MHVLYVIYFHVKSSIISVKDFFVEKEVDTEQSEDWLSYIQLIGVRIS